MGDFELISFSTADGLAHAAAAAWLKEVEAARRAGAVHRAAVSGGRIARTFFLAITEQARLNGVSLDSVHFFWADERCVPPDDPESNFGMARQFLFTPSRIAAGQIHRIRGEDSPGFAAASAEAELCRIAPLDKTGQPVLDIVFLGMGEDGHVASLFPGEDESARSSRPVYRAVFATKPPPRRVTLGYGTIAAARRVWLLASGAGKEAALRESFRPGSQTPLARVLGMRGQTRIFSDIPLT